MFDPSTDEEEKLRQARALFERACDHFDDHNKEAKKAALFFHNTQREGQWESQDLVYLQRQGRPALSFNVCKPKVDSMLGMAEDVMQKAAPTAVGAEDQFVSTVLGMLLDRQRSDSKMDDIDSLVMERGMVRGSGPVAFDVIRDPENPLRQKVVVHPLMSHEVKWDPAAHRPDRADAQYLFWDKWVTVAEFKRDFPHLAEKADDFLKLEDHTQTETAFDEDLTEADPLYRYDRDYEDERLFDYLDRKRQLIRMVHMEYKAAVEVHFLINPELQISEKIPEKAVGAIRTRLKEGGFPGFELVSTWRDEVYWLEFIRNEVLWDEPSPMPFDGFSITDFVCYFDDVDNAPYGVMRNLIDPQLEVNKSLSQMLDHVITQGKPGWIAEEGAIPDIDSFERSLNVGGGVGTVTDGALTASRVQERKPATLPEGAFKRMDASLTLIDRIAGVGSELESPSRHAEAMGTVQLRYRRAQVGMRTIFKHYAIYQVATATRFLQTMTRVYDDHQLAEMLGKEGRYVVEEGVIYEVQTDPQTQQQQVTNQADIGGMRKLRYDVELVSTTQNNTLRLLELNILTQLMGANVPIDPVMLIEKAVSSPSDRERLTVFARQQLQQAAAASQKQAQDATEQIQGVMQIEAGKIAEDQRHNIAGEEGKKEKQRNDLVVAFAKLYQESAESEQQFLLSLLQERGREENVSSGN